MFDDHLHSDMSADARATVAEVCRAALERGLAGITVTDHFDTELADSGYGCYDFGRLSREVEEARRRCGERLSIHVGAEIDFQPEFAPAIAAFVAASPLDLSLGGVHWVAHELVDTEYCRRRSAVATYEDYFAALEQAVASGLFDAIAHFDLPKRHAAAVHGPFDLARHWPSIERVLRLMVERGTALEINTSGWRRGQGEPLPGEAILRRYRELGGMRITIGSDAHTAPNVGRDIVRAQELARRAGFSYLTRFVARRPQLIPL